MHLYSYSTQICRLELHISRVLRTIVRIPYADSEAPDQASHPYGLIRATMSAVKSMTDNETLLYIVWDSKAIISDLTDLA